ncbi:MAG: RHS repeat-associated core domain-containing protein, partial [Pseudolabrys sp.]|nr:RHS repeat-associated core domain-containing protein [Pseudolabrys sp.]
YDGATGSILRWYAYGLGPNEVLAQANLGLGTLATPIPDLLGSIVATLDPGGAPFARHGYKPYGESSSAPGQFGFTGQRIDGELGGLYYYRARHYSPAWGRFLQPDPIGHASGLNLYAYVENDPLNAVDPTGNWLETGWDLFNIGLGTASLISNVRSESWVWAAVDAVGLSYDIVATAVPFLPAGASAGITSLRAGNSIRTSFNIGADTIATANIANRVTSSAPTLANAGAQGTRYHTEVGAALDVNRRLSEGARNAFGGRNRAIGGPDVSWPGTNVWLDFTTAGQWTRHEARYERGYGTGVSLLYSAGRGLSGGLKTGGGMTLWGAQTSFGIGEAHGAAVSGAK